MRERVIRVKGRGIVSMPPDCIQINIKLNETYLSYEESMKAAAESIDEIRKALEPYGFSKKDIKTNKFAIDSRYESVRDDKGNYNRVFLGYKYNHNLNIEFDNDNKKLGKVLFSLSKCFCSPEFSIIYKMKDYTEMQKKLLENAVSDAKIKAEIIAKASEVQIGDILDIDYSWSDINIYHEDNVMYDDIDCCDSEINAIDLEAEDLSTSDTVTVTWQII